MYRCPPEPLFQLLPYPPLFTLLQSTSFGSPASQMKLPLAIYFTFGNVYISVLFSQIIPPHLLLCPKVSSLCCVSFVALHIGLSVPSFKISYMCINIYLSFSFCLTSLCIIVSMFIHFIGTDSNVFFFIVE